MYTHPTASATFYEDTGTSSKACSMCFIECDEEIFRLVKLNWGAEEDYERSCDGEVEMIWGVQGEYLTRLKEICNNSKTSDDVVRYLYERFAPYKRLAGNELLKWLETKKVVVSFAMY